MGTLNKYEVEDIITRLQKGEDIPDDYKLKLFPAKQKEYEMTYAGKMRKEDILSNEDGVFPVPLQVEKVYNGERKSYKDGWRNMIVYGDNLQFLKTCYEDKDPLVKGLVKGKVKLIYIDPPFATESDFNTGSGAKAYSDKVKGAEFIEFLRRRLVLAKELLAKDGSIFVHLDQKKIHHIKLVLDEIFGESNFRNEIVWKRTSAHNDAGKLGINIEYILYYSNSETFTWNQLYDSYSEKHLKRFRNKDKRGLWTDSPLTAKGLKGAGYTYEYKGISGYWRCPISTMKELDKDDRLHFTKNGGIRVKKYLNELPGIPLQALWDTINPINSQSKERVNYPTQKPEELLQRIISMTTNEGDIVLDFFAGSGVTAAVCEKMKRKWIASDIGKLSFYTIQKRILHIESGKSLEDENKLYGQPAKSFITVNTGYYDLEKVFELGESNYTTFVLNLFEIEPTRKKIGGVKINGVRKDGYNAIVFPYWLFKDAQVDEEYIEDLHSHIGKKVGNRVYIVAPANFVAFFNDYFEIDGVRYYFLKVPYHLIKELHKVEFKKFRQPQSKSNVNDLENAIGFHFMRPPLVSSELKQNKSKAQIIINSFHSDFSEEETGKELPNFSSLAMVLIDMDFNGQYFEMDEGFFAEDLLPKKKKKNEELNVKNELTELKKIELPEIDIKKCGKKVMVVYIDVYGNEFKEEFKIKGK